MSIDLRVYCADRPHAELWLGELTSGSVVGLGSAEDPQLLNVETLRGHVCTLDGPFRVEDEDVPDTVARVQLVTRWLIEISMASDSSKGVVSESQNIAKGLAQRAGGVVYDPQADEVIWPRGRKALRAAPPRSGDDGAVELELAFARRLTSLDGARLLSLVDRSMPEALPRRFGDFEPMQGRLERDGSAAFTSMWDGSSSLFWSGARPFARGHVGLSRGWGAALDPATREARRTIVGGRKEQDIDSITLGFRLDILGDQRWIEAVASLFRTVCASLQPFIAAAYRSPTTDGRRFKLSARTWYGLPAEATWLTYIGEPYLSDLRTKLLVEQLGAGALVHVTETPDDVADARDALGWPHDLLRGGDQLNRERAAHSIPDLQS